MDAWTSTPEADLPAECPSTNDAGYNFGDCYSGWRVRSLCIIYFKEEWILNMHYKQVDACDKPYDFTSVMHYRLTSFCADCSQNTMTPKVAPSWRATTMVAK